MKIRQAPKSIPEQEQEGLRLEMTWQQDQRRDIPKRLNKKQVYGFRGLCLCLFSIWLCGIMYYLMFFYKHPASGQMSHLRHNAAVKMSSSSSVHEMTLSLTRANESSTDEIKAQRGSPPLLLDEQESIVSVGISKSRKLSDLAPNYEGQNSSDGAAVTQDNTWASSILHQAYFHIRAKVKFLHYT